jgi:uncharacterized protein HemX
MSNNIGYARVSTTDESTDLQVDALTLAGTASIGANNPRSDIKIESVNAPWWRNLYAGATRVIKG